MLALELRDRRSRLGQPARRRRRPRCSRSPTASTSGSADKYFYCLDADDGEIDWASAIGRRVRGRRHADDAHVYFASLDNLLRAFDRTQRRAAAGSDGVPFRPIAGPVVVGSTRRRRRADRARLRAFDVGDRHSLPARSRSTEPLAVAPAGVRPIRRSAALIVVALTGEPQRQQWKLSLAVPRCDATAGCAAHRAAGRRSVTVAAGVRAPPVRRGPRPPAARRLRESARASAPRTTAGSMLRPPPFDEERVARDVDDAVLDRARDQRVGVDPLAAASPRGRIRRAAPAS